MRPRLIAAAVLVGLLLLFIAQNTRTVSIAFLFWETEMSRALLLLIVFLLGTLTGWLFRSTRQRRRLQH